MFLTLAGKIPAIELEDAVPVAPVIRVEPEPVGMFTAEELTPVVPLPAPAHVNPAAAAFTAPAQPVAPVAPTVTGVELDPDGLPWDARIHAGTKGKNQDGRWKKKKGIDAAIIAEVEAELRAVMGAPVAEVVVPAPVPVVPVAEVVAPAPVPVVPVAPVVAPVAATETPADFPAFLRAASGRVRDGLITTPDLNVIVNRHGVANMQLLGSRPDLIPQIWADVVGHGQPA
jgi:hypothetical protein